MMFLQFAQGREHSQYCEQGWNSVRMEPKLECTQQYRTLCFSVGRVWRARKRQMRKCVFPFSSYTLIVFVVLFYFPAFDFAFPFRSLFCLFVLLSPFSCHAFTTTTTKRLWYTSPLDIVRYTRFVFLKVEWCDGMLFCVVVWIGIVTVRAPYDFNDGNNDIHNHSKQTFG